MTLKENSFEEFTGHRQNHLVAVKASFILLVKDDTLRWLKFKHYVCHRFVVEELYELVSVRSLAIILGVVVIIVIF